MKTTITWKVWDRADGSYIGEKTYTTWSDVVAASIIERLDSQLHTEIIEIERVG